MRDNLQIGDEVTTIGGIVGIVCAIADKDDTLVIETGSDRTKIRVLKSAIARNNTQHEAVTTEVETAKASKDKKSGKNEIK